MYNNVGKQIKAFASIFATIEAVGSVITGIIFMCVDFEYFWWLGLIIIVGGLFVSWISNLFLYAYGELVDKTCLIEDHLNPSNINSPVAKQNRTTGTNEWKCKKCGVINQNYVGTCGCGQTKAEN